MTDCQVFGLNPWGHHLTSVLLHGLNTALFFLFLSAATGTTWRSLAAAALFGVHPLRVESVAWVAERKDVLSVCWAILSLWAYTKWVRASSQPGGPGRRYYWLAVFFFFCGLMSKVMVITLPFLFLLLDIWPLNRWPDVRGNGPGRRRLWVEKIPFFALALAAGLAVVWVNPRGATKRPVNCFTFGIRLSNGLVSYWRYLYKTFWPVDLAVNYPYPTSGQWPTPEVALAVAGLLLVSLLAAARVKSHPWLLVGWFWFLGALTPVIGLVLPGSQSMADRYMYIPSMGLFILLVWTGHLLACRSPRWRRALAGVAVAAVVACCLLTVRQITYWKDNEVLFRHALAVTKNNAFAHFGLGAALISKGDPVGAERELRQAVELSPLTAEFHFNLGIALQLQGRLGEAMANFKTGLSLAPDDHKARFLYGTVLAQARQFDQAAREFQAAIRLQPENAVYYNNLGLALRNMGREEEAIAQYRAALAIDPRYTEARNNLGAALGRAGRFEEAARVFQQVVADAPDYAEAHNNLGLSLENLGRFDDAITQYREALRLAPGYTAARENLDAALQLKAEKK
jgi:Flp pilus assembly protein TadD